LYTDEKEFEMSCYYIPFIMYGRTYVQAEGAAEAQEKFDEMNLTEMIDTSKMDEVETEDPVLDRWLKDYSGANQ
jgi:hypothetical protein